MKTCTFLDIFNQGYEFAKRTRDQFPVQEQVLQQGFLATEFEDLFTQQIWPFLVPPFQAVTVANGCFSKNEGQANEIGDVLAILTQDPHVSHCWERVLDWHEGTDGNGNAVIWVPGTCRTPLYVEYLLPYPGPTFPELAPMTQAQFWAALCPRQWRSMLAHKAAAHMLGSDSPELAAASAAQFALAQSMYVSQVQRLADQPIPEWRGAHIASHCRGTGWR